MNDAQLRALVREAVLRHVASPSAAPSTVTPHAQPALSAPPRAHVQAGSPAAGVTNLSHAMYLTLVNPGDACLIEPAVACNHCGYCQCHGH